MQALEHNIMSLSYRGRWFFIGFFTLLIIGVIGGLVTLSNMFTTPLPDYGGTYHEGIVGSPRFINPVLAFSDADHDLTNLVYNGLVRLNAHGEIIPDLASSWTISPDGKLYTFTLKDNLVFHDGKPLTAYDVVFTIESIQNPIIKSPLKVPWTGIAVSAPDAKTVVFELPKAYAGFLNQATVGIIPEHLWSPFTSIEEWQTSHYNTEPIGSGPFRTISIRRSKTGVPQRYVLQSFKRFALGKPFISKVVISSFANTADAANTFMNADLDGLASFEPQNAARVGPLVASTTQSAPRIFSLFMNGEKNPVLKDTAVVKALKLVAPKEEIVSEVFSGYADPLKGPLPLFVENREAPADERKTQAAELLEKAGWKLNETTSIREKTGQPLTFILATANTTDLRKSAEIIARELRTVGIQVNLQFFELGTLQENIIRKREFEMLLFGQVIKHDTDLFAFWHSTQRTDPGLNIVNYFNTKSDKLLDTALTETDRDARMDIYQDLSVELDATGPVIFLYAPRTILLTRPKVQGISLPPLSQPADRFSTIYEWYIRTDHVWNIFAR